MLSVALYAQHNVTKFLGIPVDGSKASMIQKLKSKGFVYNNLGYLEGVFNGEKAKLYIVTNKNKVWRIAVINKRKSDEAQIKTRYNILIDQFSNNRRYVPVAAEKLSQTENIGYGITLHHKEYQAVFAQLPADENVDKRTVWISIYMDSSISEEYGIALYYDNMLNQANGEDL